MFLLSNCKTGTSLVGQWLGVHPSNAGGWLQSLVWGLRSHMP